MLLRTRHMVEYFKQYIQPNNHPDGSNYIPGGVDLERPFPEARILFIEAKDGWVYVWWVDNKLMSPEIGE